MKKTIIQYIFAIILLVGGIMGVFKGLLPNAYWLSFRHLLTGTATYEVNKMPMYVQIYGFIMGCLEIIAAAFIFSMKQALKKYVIMIMLVNAIGCIVAILYGDMFAILSLLSRIILILFLVSTEEK